MKLLRTLLFAWFSLGLCVPGWAFSPDACAAEGNESEQSAHAGHEHHGGAIQPATDDQSDQLGQGDFPGPCDCCDACTTACTLGVTAISPDQEFRSWPQDRHVSSTGYVGLYSDPQSHPPFRPPILTS